MIILLLLLLLLLLLSLGVAVTPAAITRLDVSPYNEFSLTCNVTTNPAANNRTVMYSWPQEDDYGTGVVSEDGAMLNVTFNRAAGMYMYSCNPNVTISGATGIAMPTNSTNVTIKGN